MKLIICSIYDSKAEAFMQPLFFQAKGQAVRSFADAVNQDGNFKNHPDDYTLFCIGSYDDATGLLEPIAPESLGNGVQYSNAAPLSLSK